MLLCVVFAQTALSKKLVEGLWVEPSSRTLGRLRGYRGSVALLKRCVHICIYTHTDVHVYVYVYTVYIYVYIYVYKCMYVYVGEFAFGVLL